MERLDLDFYYGQEAEQFAFYQLPKALITDNRFKEVSNNVKLLYGLMLDRIAVSFHHKSICTERIAVQIFL